MIFSELFLLAVGLSMDAFAVSVCKGLSLEKVRPKHILLAGLYFGAFQAGMPLIGYFLGAGFRSYIADIDHWIAFTLLAFIGLNMVRESHEKEREIPADATLKCGCTPDAGADAAFGVKAMIPAAVATSIDALAVGVTFAFLGADIVSAVSVIGLVTFALSALGVVIGNVFGARFKQKAELAGGLVLILIGLKILLEHLVF